MTTAPDSPPRPTIDQTVTFLYAEQPELSWRFYEEVMGLRPVQDQGNCRIYAPTAGSVAFLGVCRARAPRMTDNPRVAGGVMFTFVAEDVDGWHDYLTAHGVAIARPPSLSAQYRVYHFFFRDPAGYMLEIQRFDRPDWPAP